MHRLVSRWILLLALVPATLSASPMTPDSGLGPGPVIPEVPPGCANAIVDDDGSVESGYSWVPSAVEGIYVQEYQLAEVPSGVLTTACVCWLRTRMDDTIDFEVVVYQHNPAEESPRKEPFAAIPAQLAGIPQGIPGATFTEVPLGEVQLPSEGPFYVGVRWDPGLNEFFFICVDKTDGPGEPTRVFFRDDRFPASWGVSDQTNDSTFNNHRALFVRPVPAPGSVTEPADIPVSRVASVALLAALLLLGVVSARRI